MIVLCYYLRGARSVRRSWRSLALAVATVAIVLGRSEHTTVQVQLRAFELIEIDTAVVRYPPAWLKHSAVFQGSTASPLSRIATTETENGACNVGPWNGVQKARLHQALASQPDTTERRVPRHGKRGNQDCAHLEDFFL